MKSSSVNIQRRITPEWCSRLPAPKVTSTSKTAAVPELDAGINFDNAIQAHADWKTKLRSVAMNNQQLDAQTIGRNNCCELGKWLHGAGNSRFGGKPSFVDLIAARAAFHIEAGKVAQVINQGDGA